MVEALAVEAGEARQDGLLSEGATAGEQTFQKCVRTDCGWRNDAAFNALLNSTAFA